ncbi:MAG: hypothetical protein K9I48_06710 [Sphingobacteriales bacterium]|nr:hypothetical protein [Sphingobacteriales bacterium]
MRNANYSPSAITSGYRTIKNGSKFNPLFPKVNFVDEVLIEDGEVDDTVELMKKVVGTYLDDTKELSKQLKQKSEAKTCEAIWNFIYTYIQYKLDKKGLEQLRRPARSWAERETGVDCDCMSIFSSSILSNLNIPHSFRITRYSEMHWQHVYVVAHLSTGDYIIDGVISSANYEKPYTEKIDYPMNLNGIKVAVLHGTESNDHYNAVFAPELSGLGSNTNSELDNLYQHLITTRNAIAQNPNIISTVDDPKAFLKMLDYAIQYWYTDKRDEALAVLSKNEEALNLRNGYSINAFDEDELEGLGELGSLKSFFSKVKKTVQKVGDKIGQGAKAVVKGVIRFNPVSIAARNGFLLALKLDVQKMASKLKWGYATKEQAAKKGISEAQWNKSKDALAKVERLFADKLQGKREALKNAMLKGRAGNLNGVVEEMDFAGLGEPVSMAAAIASATPIIVATVAILKKSGLVGANENIDPNAIATEISKNPEILNTISDDQNSITMDNSKEVSSLDKLLTLAKNNPIPTAIGIGVVGFGAYKLFSKDKPKSNGTLSGLKYKPKKKSSHRNTASNKQKIKSISLT